MGKGTMRDTVDGPRAMVIHLRHTSADSHQKPTSLAGGRREQPSPPTDFAVMCPRGLVRFTLPTPS